MVRSRPRVRLHPRRLRRVHHDGEQFGPYRLVRRIARSGMAEVFLARESLSSGGTRLVVIKRIHPEMTDSAEIMTMFSDEARLASLLHHPNIVSVLGSGDVEGVPFLALEHIEGTTLTELLRANRGALPLGVALSVARDMCLGLHHAHGLSDDEGRSLGVVHRDVSPANVMVTRRGEAELIDFGVARAATQNHVTGVGQLKGKLAYMAPEMARNTTVDRRADVFATGIVLFEMVTGTRLFRRSSDAATLAAIVHEDPPSVEPFGAPPALDWVLATALQKDRARRFPTAEALRQALDEVVAEAGVSVTRDEVQRFVAPHLQDVLDPEDLGRADTERISPAIAIAAGAEGDASGLPFEVAPRDDASTHDPTRPRPPDEPLRPPPGPELATSGASAPRRRVPLWVWIGVGLAVVAAVGASYVLGANLAM